MTARQTLMLRLLSLGVAIAVLALVLASAEPGEIWRALRDVEVRPLVAVTLLNLPVCLLFSLRSLLVLKRLGYVVPWLVLLPASVLGNVAGALTPAGATILRLPASSPGPKDHAKSS